MNVHKNARLTPHGRERIVRQVESGQTLKAVGEAAASARGPFANGFADIAARVWLDYAIAVRGPIGCIGRRLRRWSPRSRVSAASATLASRSRPGCASRQRPSAAFCGAWGSIGWQRWSLPSRCAVTSVNILAN